jgi:hypothetical protein
LSIFCGCFGCAAAPLLLALLHATMTAQTSAARHAETADLTVGLTMPELPNLPKEIER